MDDCRAADEERCLDRREAREEADEAMRADEAETEGRKEGGGEGEKEEGSESLVGGARVAAVRTNRAVDTLRRLKGANGA